MKRLLQLVLLLVALPTMAAVSLPPVGDVTLSWSSTQPLTTNATFVIYHSPVLNTNFLTWAVATNVIGTSTQATVRITPGEHYFVCVKSNLWGLSSFSNVAAVPPLPLPPLLSIQGAN